MLLLLAIAGCKEKEHGSEVAASVVASQKTNVYGQFTTKGPTPEEKFTDLKRRAESGDVKSQFGLARMYYNGDGTTKDDAKAAEWYRKAAEQGNAFSQYKLGAMYDKGEGVPKDAAKAVEWWQKAAAQGDEAAQESLKQMPLK